MLSALTYSKNSLQTFKNAEKGERRKYSLKSTEEDEDLFHCLLTSKILIPEQCNNFPVETYHAFHPNAISIPIVSDFLLLLKYTYTHSHKYVKKSLLQTEGMWDNMPRISSI